MADRAETERQEALEKLIDAVGLATVLLDLATVAHAKSEHLSTNWGDTSTAMAWSKAARAIIRLSETREIKGVTP